METIRDINGAKAVIGLSWGDESKGGTVDALYRSGTVGRYGGGDNAGHTVTIGQEILRLHLIPSAIAHPDSLCFLGTGMVINPLTLVEELIDIQAKGITIDPSRLMIDHRAQMIMPWHIMKDAIREAKKGKAAIGTTLRGIGPAYGDKTERNGPRIEDLARDDFEAYLLQRIAEEEPMIRAMADHGEVAEAVAYLSQEEENGLLSSSQQRFLNVLRRTRSSQPFNTKGLLEDLNRARQIILPHVQDTVIKVSRQIDQGDNVIFEGAQGVLLDLDAGTHPYVTSSHPGASGIATAYGIYPHQLQYVLGVTKAFNSRVGSGPMITELHNEEAARLRGTGENPWDEYGTTTGRPRRVGWNDAVTGRWAVKWGGATALAIAKMDILAGIEPVRLCVGYKVGNTVYETPPSMDASFLAQVEPVYQNFDGWEMPAEPIRHWDEQPENAQKYLQALEKSYGIPVRMVSWGADRRAKIFR